MTRHCCAVCGAEKPVWRCSQCGRAACNDHYGERAAQCFECLQADGGEHHPRSVLHPVSH